MSTREMRMQRARQSLEGLSVGDAFGERFFLSWETISTMIARGDVSGPPYDFINEEAVSFLIARRKVPSEKIWPITDDTRMALSIVAILARHGEILQDELARSFGEYYLQQPARGYGAAMHTLLPRLARGANWREETSTLFGGEGSFGNGAAMRVAPLGAYFADDFDACVENARRSAEVTHAHDEGVAGAIAVAVGAALAWQIRDENQSVSAREFLERVLERTPPSEVAKGLEQAGDLDDIPADEAAEILGSGQNVTAQDTVPFVLWCAANYLENFEEAMWETVSGLGDRDTTCAMVGGIVALSSSTPIPQNWLERREALPLVL